MKYAVVVAIILLSFISSAVPDYRGISRQLTSTVDSIIQVPIGGNTSAQNATRRSTLITNAGIENWDDGETQFNTYLRISRPGTIKLTLHAKTDGQSSLQLTLNGQQKTVVVNTNVFTIYEAGVWKVNDTGYLNITLRGLSKTGKRFADVSHYAISGTAIKGQTAYVKINAGNFFYWGRRGPSVHLNFPIAESIKARWFYNEVTVPEGQDLIGSYFMAIGFGEGYFGIQVNAPAERRILFSVWSPYSTDDPKRIPPDMRIALLKRGANVHTGEFGNEGSGGQSYLRYNWKAGLVYKFLLKGEPDSNDNTTYTAYFFEPEKKEWRLIASFKRPKTNTYLKRFHSFLENFIPEQGDKERRVLFSNQWMADAYGTWTELVNAVFTYDNTAAKGYRMDYAGGVQGGQFFLKNCGFFSQYTPYKANFKRKPRYSRPDINFNQLP